MLGDLRVQLFFEAVRNIELLRAFKGFTVEKVPQEDHESLFGFSIFMLQEWPVVAI